MTYIISSIVISSIIAALIGRKLITSSEYLPWYARFLNIFKPKYPISGHCNNGYETVKDTFVGHFLEGSEVGSSVAVYVGDKCVLELYGGFKDFKTRELYDKDTLNIVFSSSKFMTSAVIAKLVDQGLLDYDEKITKYWPNFGNNGKDNIRLCDVLRHEGGLAFFNDPQPDLETIYDSKKLKKVLEDHPHVFNGEVQRCYHGVTRGMILNEIVKSVDIKGRTVGQIYKEDINPEYEMEFYLGLDKDKISRRAKFYAYPLLDTFILFLPKWLIGEKAVRVNFDMMKKDSYLMKVMKLKLSKDWDMPNADDIINVEFASCNGHTNAKSLAKMAAFFANEGKVDGKRFISKFTAEASISEPIKRLDLAILMDTVFTKGGFAEFRFPELNDLGDFPFYGWCGMGGSLVFFNVEYNFAFSYVMNTQHMIMLGEGKGARLLINAFRACVEQKKKSK